MSERKTKIVKQYKKEEYKILKLYEFLVWNKELKRIYIFVQKF